MQVNLRAKESGRSEEEEASLLVSEKQPNGRFLGVKDLAAMVDFVCSDAGKGITGQALTIDGRMDSSIYSVEAKIIQDIEWIDIQITVAS